MHQIKRTLVLPVSLPAFWDFFLSPDSLALISPPHVRLEIVGEAPEKIQEGQIIEYRMKPMLGIPLRWVAEITTLKEHVFFVDEQRKGPFRSWRHEHHFREVDRGVEMTDLLSYSLPFGFLGQLAHFLFVKQKLERIFDHRRNALERIFGKA